MRPLCHNKVYAARDQTEWNQCGKITKQGTKMKNKFFCLQNIVQKKCTFIKLLKIFYIKVLKLKLNSKSNKQIPTAKINHTKAQKHFGRIYYFTIRKQWSYIPNKLINRQYCYLKSYIHFYKGVSKVCMKTYLHIAFLNHITHWFNFHTTNTSILNAHINIHTQDI